MWRTTIVVAAAAAAATVAISALPAHAEPDQAPVDPYGHHRGVMVGFGLGFSTASCDQDCRSVTSLGLDFNLGGFLNPRLALMYDAASWADSDQGATFVLAVNTVAVQYWLSPRGWIKGGAGISQARISGNGGSDSESAEHVNENEKFLFEV